MEVADDKLRRSSAHLGPRRLSSGPREMLAWAALSRVRRHRKCLSCDGHQAVDLTPPRGKLRAPVVVVPQLWT